MSAFRTLHDRRAAIKARVDAALKSLGPRSWEYEGEFRARCAIANCEWIKIRDTLVDNIVIVKGTHGRGSNGNSRRAIAGSPAFAVEMRKVMNG